MKKRNLFVLAMMVFGLSAYCQDNTVASGGHASGAAGNSNYTVGQAFVNYTDDGNYNVSEGVQQPYEISVLLGLEEKSISLNMVAFPNPVNSVLNLSMNEFKAEGMSYQLYSAQSKLIASERIVGINTEINMVDLAKGIYIVSIVGESKVVKTFKVIKN